MNYRQMTMDDYDPVMRLLRNTAGVRLRDADSREATRRYLERNAGLSFVAVQASGEIVGCAMSGHDGRRGYLQHVAIAERSRGQGIGSKLVDLCVSKLEELGICKVHIDVLVENESAIRFWEHCGWQKRQDIFRYSFSSGDNSNS